MRKARKPDFFEDAGHFAEEIDHLAVRLPQFDPQCLKGEHHPLGEPATPFGVGGFVRVPDNLFNVRDCITGEETEFGFQTNLFLRFLRR